MTITQRNIEKLFDQLWPAMISAQEHKHNCLDNIEAINGYFKKSPDDHNLLLNNLWSLDGIGLTIGSGLIWSVYPKNRVPFDKYTLTYAIKLEIIPSVRISENYISYSTKIKKFCNGFMKGKRRFSIEDFVREAMEQLSESEYYAEPK